MKVSGYNIRVKSSKEIDIMIIRCLDTHNNQSTNQYIKKKGETTMKLRILLNLVSNEFVRDNRGNKESQAKETFNEILDSSYVEESQEGLIFTSFLSPYSIKLEEKHLEEEVVIANPILFQRQVNGDWDITDTLGSDNFIKHLAREANNSVVEGKAEQAVLVVKKDGLESLEMGLRNILEHLIVVSIE